MRVENTKKLFLTDECRADAAIWALWEDILNPMRIPIPKDPIALQFIINNSRRGTPWICVVANIIKYHYLIHPEAFGFKVDFPYVDGEIAYIITRRPTRPRELYRAIRAQHNLIKSVRLWDTFTTARFLEVFVDIEFLDLMVPRFRGASGNPGREGRTHGHRLKKVLHGARRRAADAGLIPREMEQRP
jgi:hypothetical protein